jgi:holo-[acyl-carrier protein] synthase
VTEGASDLSDSGVVGIGTDLVDVDRFRTVLRRRPSVADRLFTAGERSYADRAVDPAARLAARFAAKEAALKALGFGLGGMRMADIEVVRDDDGRPEILLHGAARLRATEQGVSRWLVSLSHTDHLAQATVLALAR